MMESRQIADAKKLERDSNMELLRIVCMLLVIVLHADYMSLGGPSQPDTVCNAVGTFTKIFIFAFSMVSVNCFILISGWYGIRPKIKRLAGLLFQVFFICGFSLLLYSQLSHHKLEFSDLKSYLLLTDDLWFVKSYIILYLLSPALNAFGKWANQRQYRLVLAGLFIFQTVYGWLSAGVIWIAGGYSPYSFIFLYLLAQYMRLYPNKMTNKGPYFYLSFFLSITLTASIVSFLSIRYSIGEGISWLSMVSPFIILESVLFMLFFSKLCIKSKIINWIASSCFAVYLFHCTPITLDGFCAQVRKFHSVGDYLSIGVMIIVIYIISIVLDKVRIQIWKILFMRARNKLF